MRLAERGCGTAALIAILAVAILIGPVLAGNTVTVSGEIVAAQPPVAAFTATPTSGYTPLTVQFTDQSSNTPTSWKWEYRKGGSSWMQFSTDQNPSYTFAATGTYSIRLTATNAGGSDKETKTGYITVSAPQKPVAAFTAAPRSGYDTLTVQFTDQSSNTPTLWKWEYRKGGGSWTQFSTDQNPSYTFTATGTYSIRLKATNAGGSDKETKTGYITVIPSVIRPVAIFTQNKYIGRSPITVQFTDHSLNNPTSWSWKFDDGGTSTETNPSHRFTRSGIYIIQERVSNSAGSDTAYGIVIAL